MPMTSKQMVKYLEENGFECDHQTGSHLTMRHSNGHVTVVPMHNKDLGKGLEQKILKQAGLKYQKGD